MKVRWDFVTNSSSASYILSFKGPNAGWTEEDVIDNLAGLFSYLDEEYFYWDGGPLKGKKDEAKFREILGGRLKRDGEVFHLHEDTSMHNGFREDVPAYMTEFLMAMLAGDSHYTFVKFDRIPD